MIVFFAKSAFEFWAVIFEPYRPFLNFAFTVVLGETLLPKGAYRPWDHFRFFGKTLPLRVKSWFFGISLISIFSL